MGATGNVVAGILSAWGGSNGGDGILVNAQASHNLIGTDGDGVNDSIERNLISGNASWGVQISDPGTEDNVVAENFIGSGDPGRTTTVQAGCASATGHGQPHRNRRRLGRQCRRGQPDLRQ